MRLCRHCEWNFRFQMLVEKKQKVPIRGENPVVPTGIVSEEFGVGQSPVVLSQVVSEEVSSGQVRSNVVPSEVAGTSSEDIVCVDTGVVDSNQKITQLDNYSATKRKTITGHDYSEQLSLSSCIQLVHSAMLFEDFAGSKGFFVQCEGHFGEKARIKASDARIQGDNFLQKK